jgi:outer membrane lipoprotein-sorting protein
MKKVLTLLMVLCSLLSANAQTADEVINKYLVAAGGKAKLEGIHSLQYVQTVNLNTPMGAMEINITNIKVESKLFRMNTTSEFFGSAFSVVTDTSGWVLIPGNPMSGSEATLQKLKPEERKALTSQMACDGFFPELVNYTAKGYTAEMLGETKSGGRVAYKLKLKKDKDERTYLVDKQTGLVNSMTIKGAAAANMTGMGSSGMGRSDKMEITLSFSTYQDVSGVKFPGKMKIDTRMGVIESTITGVKVNQAVDAKWYKPQ